MQQEKRERFEKAVFRSSAAFELVLFEYLSANQQQLLGAIQGNMDFYGVLRPLLHPELGLRSVDQDTARLFSTLQTPGHIPSSVRYEAGEDYYKTMLTFVFDHIFEVEWDGTWISGIEFYEAFYAGQQPAVAQGVIAQLSLDALKYAQALEHNDSMKLSTRLYCYNSIPLSARWLRKFPTSDSLAAHLGLHSRSTALVLQAQWREVTSSTSSNGWFAWSKRTSQSEYSSPDFTYKLYISPACDYIRDTFQATIAILADSQAVHFKTGKDIYGQLRPDKFVAYFTSMEACMDTAALLIQKLAGLPAHGVPFSAEIGGDGLLSWGIDPPSEEQIFTGEQGESWRLWVTNRLAMALLHAKANRPLSVEPWQFALERLRLDNVNVETWMPPRLSWHPHIGKEA